jgi:7-keto-8-aminopelargonate synthetase-like enzyme
MYVCPPTPTQTAVLIAAFDVMLAEPERRVRLQANAERVMISSHFPERGVMHPPPPIRPSLRAKIASACSCPLITRGNTSTPWSPAWTHTKAGSTCKYVST